MLPLSVRSDPDTSTSETVRFNSNDTDCSASA